MNKIQVLIADDEVHISNKIKKIIETNHSEYLVIGTAKDGAAALELLEKHPVDLLITDIRMPEITGLELATIVKNRFPLIKLIFITGYEEFEYAKKAIRLNASDFLLKPIIEAELSTTLNELAIEFSKEKKLDFGISVSQQISNEEIVHLTKKYLQENYLKSIPLNIIAEKMGISQAYLTRIYMKIEGIAPLKYQIELRMHAAKKYLKDPSLTISDISTLLNYSDQFAFSKSFKNHENMSPMDYRKTQLQVDTTFMDGRE